MLQRNLNKYTLDGVTFWTGITLGELHYPVRIERDDLSYEGTYEVRIMRRIDGDGEEQREAGTDING